MQNTNQTHPTRGRGLRRAVFVVALVVASPLVLMAFFVEDWGRDLVTNRASTDPAAADPALRPLRVSADQDGVLFALARLMMESASWSPNGETAAPPDDAPIAAIAAEHPDGLARMVRRTGLLRFQDDVWVVVEPIDDGCLIHAHSRSRVGKGDLGQNPRNLRELRAWLEKELSND